MVTRLESLFMLFKDLKLSLIEYVFSYHFTVFNLCIDICVFLVSDVFLFLIWRTFEKCIYSRVAILNFVHQKITQYFTFIKMFFFYILCFNYVCVCTLWEYVHVSTGVQGGQEGVGSPGAAITEFWAASYVFWELSLGPFPVGAVCTF